MKIRIKDKIVKRLAQEGMTVGTEDGPLFGREVPLNCGSKRKEESGAGYSTEDKTALATTSGGGLSGACSSGDAAESKGIGTGYQPQRGPGQSASSAGSALKIMMQHGNRRERRELRREVMNEFRCSPEQAEYLMQLAVMNMDADDDIRRLREEQRDLKEQTRRLEEEKKESLRVLTEQRRRLCEEKEVRRAPKAQRLVLQMGAQAEEDMSEEPPTGGGSEGY